MLIIENIIAKVASTEGFRELVNSEHATVHSAEQDSHGNYPDNSGLRPENGVRHDVPSLTRENSGESDYFVPRFTLNGALDKDEWCDQFEDAMAVGLTIINHAKEFNEGQGEYFLEIVSETTEEPYDFSDDEEDEENWDDLDTVTHLFRITVRQDGSMTLKHGHNEVEAEYGTIEIVGDPKEFIKSECHPFA